MFTISNKKLLNYILPIVFGNVTLFTHLETCRVLFDLQFLRTRLSFFLLGALFEANTYDIKNNYICDTYLNPHIFPYIDKL